MTGLLIRLRGLGASQEGAAAIEAALVLPVLLTFAFGMFDVSRVIARRGELQGAMAEASAIALATEPTTSARRATVKAIIQMSAGLTAQQVAVDAAYRCGAENQLRTSTSACGAAKISSYVKIVLTDSYAPMWTNFGVGTPIQSQVTRYVMIKQQTT